MALALVTEQPTHLDAAELATIIRRDLKAAFPGVKFSVTTSRYSMGTSVRTHWTDGPLTGAVDAVLNRYCCKGFDGMTDSTTNSGPMRLDDGRLVSIYSWVTTSRSISDALRARVADFLTRHPELVEGSAQDTMHRVSWRSHIVNGCLIVGRL